MGSRWSVCVCFPFAKSFDVFFDVAGNLSSNYVYLPRKSPNTRNSPTVDCNKITNNNIYMQTGIVQARKNLGQGDNWPRCVCPCLALACTLRSYLRYSAVACDQAEVLKWISESVCLAPAPHHFTHHVANPIYFISRFGTANLRVGGARGGVRGLWRVVVQLI